MNTCPPARELARLLDEDAGGPETRAFEAHLEHCADCQRAVEALTAGAPAPPESAPPTVVGHEEFPRRPMRFSSGEARLTTPVSESADEAALPVVAGYEVLSELGRGGMGVVYKARHLGLGRVVALKMIRSGTGATAGEVERFRREAQALARLQHPNIVQIHEVGAHDGRPYFALEFCAGGSLADRLGGRPQPPGEAARLVETLAHALHAVHREQIVHRDLKPANVLLAACGFAPDAAPQAAVPKVTDFGLAKQLDVSGAPTPSRAILGTPSYMAPEQATGDVKRVGPAADVYALGAILYECLTGRPPFRGPTELDTVMQVVADEPVPPTRLQPKVPRDLETIALKCLAKEPRRRYAGALELAEDLGRFLRGEVIRARPVGARERLGRWARRNPAVASLAASLFVVVAGALGTITGLWLRADRLRHVAEAEKADAGAKLKLAREAADRYSTRVSENLQLRQEDLRPLRKDLLADVVPFYEKLVEGHGDDPELQTERARAYARLAKLTSEIDDNEKALALYEKATAVLEEVLLRRPGETAARQALAEAHLALGGLHSATSRLPLAEASFAKAIEEFRELGAADPENAGHGKDLALAHSQLGFLYGKTRQDDRADRELREAVRLLDEQVRAGRGGRLSRHALAESYNRLGAHHLDTGKNRAEAEAAFTKALSLFEEFGREWADDVALRIGLQDECATALRNLCVIYLETNRAREAEPRLEKLIAIREGIAQRQPTVTHFQVELAKAHNTLGGIQLKTARFGQAEPHFARAIEIHERLVSLHPTVTAYAQELAGFFMNRGSALAAADKDEASLEWFGKAADAFENVLRQEPGNRQAKQLAWYPHHKRGEALTSLGRYEDAVREMERAWLLREGPDRSLGAADLAASQNNLGVSWLGKDRLPEAEAAFKNALVRAEQLVEEKPGEVGPEELAADCHTNLGVVHYRARRLSECEAAHGKALAIKERLAGRHPELPELRFGLAVSLNNLCVLYGDARRFDEAAAASKRAVGVLEALVAEHGDNLKYKSHLGGAYCNRGIRARDSGRPAAEQTEWYAKAVRTLEPLMGKVRDHPTAPEHLRNAYWERAAVHTEQGRHAEAVADWDKAILLDTGARKDQFRLARAADLARLGDHARAAAEADALARSASLDADALYDLSRVHALAAAAARKDGKLTAAERDERVRHGLRRGVGLLERARDAGYFKSASDVEALKSDKEFAPLRESADFAQVLRELEKGGAKSP